jgi:hypothetical protein
MSASGTMVYTRVLNRDEAGSKYRNPNVYFEAGLAAVWEKKREVVSGSKLQPTGSQTPSAWLTNFIPDRSASDSAETERWIAVQRSQCGNEALEYT